MRIEDVERESSLFVSEADHALVLIEKIRALLDSHVSPSINLRNELLETLEVADSRYRSVMDAALAMGADGDNRPVEWYVGVIAEAESHRREIEDALLVLARFVSVGSEKSLYDNAFAPFRETAKQKAQQIADGALGQDPHDLIEVEDSFLKAVELGGDGLEDEGGLKLIDELDHHFPGTIIAGITRDSFQEGFYELGDFTSPVTLSSGLYTSADDESVKSVQEVPGDERPVGEVLDTGTREEFSAEVFEPYASSTEHDTQEVLAEDDDSILGDVDTSDGGDEPDDHFYPLQVSWSPKSLSISSWKREFVNSAPKSIRVTLPILTFFGCLVEEQMRALSIFLSNHIYTSADVRRSIDYMVRKGLAVTYQIGDVKAYCTSDLCSRLVSNKGIQALREGKAPFWLMTLTDNSIGFDERLDAVFADRRIGRGAQYLDFVLALDALHRKNRLGPVEYGADFIDDDMLQVYFTWKGTKRSSVLLSNGETVPEGADSIVVLLYEDFEAETYDGFTGDVFVVRDGKLSLLRASSVDADAVEEPPAEDSVEQPDGTELIADDVPITAVVDSEVDGQAESSAELGSSETTGDDEEAVVQADGPIEEVEISEEPEADADATPVTDAEAESEADTEAESKAGEEADQDAEVEDDGFAPGDSVPEVVEDDATQAAEVASQLAGKSSPFELPNDGKAVPADEWFLNLATSLMQNIDAALPAKADYTDIPIAMTLLLASAQVEGHRESEHLVEMLDLATGQRLTGQDHVGTTIARAFTDYEQEYEPVMLAALLQALIAPQIEQDYTLRSLGQDYVANYEQIFPSYPAFKGLLNELVRDLGQFIEHGPREGFSPRIVRSLDDRRASEKQIEQISGEASQLIEQPRYKTYVNGIDELSRACFGNNSNLQECMRIVESDRRADQLLVEEVLSSYLDPTTSSISTEAIESRIDAQWDEARRHDSSIHVKQLKHMLRAKVVEAFRVRLDVMMRWLDLGMAPSDESRLTRLVSMRHRIIEEIDRLLSNGGGADQHDFANVLYFSLVVLKTRLTSEYDPSQPFTDFLRTGYVSLDTKGYPVLDENLAVIKYYEPWRLVLLHLSEREGITFQDAVERIYEEGSPSYDNLGQLERLSEVLSGGGAAFEIDQKQVGVIVDDARHAYDEFQSELEMDYLYNKINEVQKESLSAVARTYMDDFFERRDFGCWRQFLDALRHQIADVAAGREAELLGRLDTCRRSLKRGKASPLLDEASKLILTYHNLAVAEEYLNRFEAGETDLSEDDSARLQGQDGFEEFISDAVFQPIYKLCIDSRGKQFSSFSTKYVEARFPVEWTNRQKDDSKKFLKSWPTDVRKTKSEDISDLLRGIGIQTRGVQVLYPGTRYQVTVKPSDKDRADYPHPISAFGTQAISPLRVLVLYGNQRPEEIIENVARENVGGMSVVIVNYAISLSERRQMAEMFHTKQSRLNPFIVIDQVLAIHLALHIQTERMPLMLRCTLPFTYYQPFVRDVGFTDDEMFFGRSDELRTIINPTGASVVYGGRQLGKTALLRRARSLRNHPAIKEYAIFVSILSCDSEASAAAAISQAIDKNVTGFGTYKTLKNLCQCLEQFMLDGSINRLLLLIDECDKFLASISDNKYLQLQPLVDLKERTDSKFKFVIAGLHNVCRAKNATSDNGIFGQLGEPLCVRPLKPSEAMQLIRRPLTYLGFRIDRLPHLETILTNTNYYPGILQFFGHELVESMTRQYGDYYRAVDGNPPYTLQPEQLGQILNSAQINNSIKEKFRWSLELDPRYFMIARCVALLYYENEENGNHVSAQEGFTAVEIKESADYWPILCLIDETPATFAVLLDEMVDMGILSKPNKERSCYRLRRYSFLNIIGPTAESILEDIENQEASE